MDIKRQNTPIGLILAGGLAVVLGVVIYGLVRTSGLTLVPLPPTATPLPTLTLDQTYGKDFVIANFDDVHSPVNGDANQFLIFGKLPVIKPAADLPASLAVYLGRWEGYSYAPPVKKDWKVVLVVQEINMQEGTAIAWVGTNLQYPSSIMEIHFRVIPGDPPSLEFQLIWPDGSKETVTFTYHREQDTLEGLTTSPVDGPYELTRDQSFYVYKDYSQYLAGKRIYSKPYKNSELQHDGLGYLVYLPEGYEDQPGKTWPLIFFLHGYGDRNNNNIFVLAKASPFMFIREKGSLPFIIVAPLLSASDYSFPEAYMDGVLAEIQAEYRVDAKRIYLTGLSMGGEATYRFAVHQPGTFAAIAPLSAYADADTLSRIGLIKDLPVWAIHGADDTIVPLAEGQQPVDALRAAGSNIKFTVLAGHDHDTWTDTYSDPAFYNWFLQYQRP